MYVYFLSTFIAGPTTTPTCVSMHSVPRVCHCMHLHVCVTAFILHVYVAAFILHVCVTAFILCVCHCLQLHVCVTAPSSFCSNYHVSENLLWRLKFIETSQLLCQTLFEIYKPYSFYFYVSILKKENIKIHNSSRSYVFYLWLLAQIFWL